MSDNICSQINFLHKKVGKTEWSGILLYSHKEGSIEDADDLVMVAEQIFLMDIGTAAGTEYINDIDSILEMVERYPRYEQGELKIGHIHSHHNMDAYFSNVDMDELQINSPSHNYYLSLIVNFKSKPVAKISTIAEKRTTEIVHSGSSEDEVIKPVPSEKVLGVYDVIVTEDLPQHFYDRYSVIRKKAEEEKKKKAAKRKRNAKKYSPRASQTVKGWDPHSTGYGAGSGQKQMNFGEPDFSEPQIDEFIYKWFNLNKNIAVVGSVDGAVDQVDLLMEDADGDTITQYVDQLENYLEDFAITIVGNDYYLTDDEYLKLVKIVIQKLEPYEDNKVIKDVLNMLQQYEEMITEAIEEYERT